MVPSPIVLESDEVAHHENPPSSNNSAHRLLPYLLIIGAGYRGTTYATAICNSNSAVVAAVIEPSDSKRWTFGQTFIWGPQGRNAPLPWEAFSSVEEYVSYETIRREQAQTTDPGMDAAIICVLDDMHLTVFSQLAPLGLQVLCEKPLATSLEDVLSFYEVLLSSWHSLGKRTILATGYVLRYSPANILLRRLIREDRVVGDVVSIEHTEPVGWWHFAHSYVRGPWRKEATSAPSLLTKSCHDIDLLLWLLCSPTTATEQPHFPSKVVSSGRLQYFHRENKPEAAGNATNCLSCPIQSLCLHSAESLYIQKLFNHGRLGKPVNNVVPDIEDVFHQKGREVASKRLLEALSEDYQSDTPAEHIRARTWYGRCVWESDNDVCDDQTVIMEWEHDPLVYPSEQVFQSSPHTAKTAHFRMVALTDAIGARRGRISGTIGEIEYDSGSIRVTDFRSGVQTVHPTPYTWDGHGGGDQGLMENFIQAVKSVKDERMDAEEAQRVYLGYPVEEMFSSHFAVFWADQARKDGKALEWDSWWELCVGQRLKGMGGKQ